MQTTPVAIGFKAHLGWLGAVGIRLDTALPEPLFARRIDLFDGADREALEPYHVAGGWHGLERSVRPADPGAVVARGRAKQLAATRLTLSGLRDGITADKLEWRHATVLVGRGHVGDLEHALNSHAHIHVAEGDAIRDAVRGALDELQIAYGEQDEKGALSEAAQRTAMSIEQMEAMLKSARPNDAPSWTKEHRTIAAATWVNSPSHS